LPPNAASDEIGRAIAGSPEWLSHGGHREQPASVLMEAVDADLTEP
jgi:hypothetical protein